MKFLFRIIGVYVGMFFGFFLLEKVPILSFVCIFAGYLGFQYIYEQIEKAIERHEKEKDEKARQAKISKIEQERKLQRRNKALGLAQKYPEATKLYFKNHWGIIKSNISDFDINDEIADVLLSHKSTYDIDEQRLNPTYKAKVLAEQEAKRKEEQARREALRQANIAYERKQEEEKKLLKTKVASWAVMNGDFHYSYLLNYYPTTCDFKASNEEWEDRWLVWNFKNTPGKTTIQNHNNALNLVIWRVKNLLITTFGQSSLKYITLVCIPASSADKTKARYEEFSKRLCDETGMSNAYYHMEVINSCAEKKFGGSGIDTINVSFDSDFFHGKYVILFDDIITKGESMLKFKKKMEELGAIVLGGISIGKTKHNK